MHATATAAKTIPMLRVRPFEPFSSIVARITEAFEREGEVVGLRGLPVNVVCFRHPDHIAQLVKDKAIGLTKLPSIMPRVKWVMRSGAYIMPGGEDWLQKRRQVQPSFTGAAVAACTDALPPIIDNFLRRWRPASGATTLDIYLEMRRLITEISFRIFLSAELSEERIAEAQKRTHEVEFHFVDLMPLWVPTPATLRFKRAARWMRALMLDLVRQRRAAPVGKDDVLALLLNLRHEATGQPWSDDAIVDEIFSIYFGASVMATTLAWGFTLISRHPEVRERLVSEAEGLFPGRLPGAADFPRMTYSHQVFNEISRLYPPSWGYPRFAEEGVEVDGYQVPARTLVIPMVWHAHRHPEFWSDPESFDPERFAPSRTGSLHPLAHFPFGAGPRKCLGANLGPRVIELVTVQMLRKHVLKSRPRFEGDPAAHFGFEICPADQVVMEVRPA